MEIQQNNGIITNNGLKTDELVNIIKEINPSAFLNTWGPTNVVQIYDPEINMQGILIIDNTTLGPAIGEIRIATDITPRQVFNNARKMTLSCALLNINFGGASAGINADPNIIDKTKYIKSFAKSISSYIPSQYIATPDRTIGQSEMAAFVEEIGDRKGATGIPEKMGGIPHELGVVGFGMSIALESSLETLQPFKGMPDNLSNAKIAIQGFDNIGCSVAKCLNNKGAKIVAVSDDWCTVSDSNGIDINKIIQFSNSKNEEHSLKRSKDLKKLPKDDIVKADCDILILTTSNELLEDENHNGVQAKCVVEGTNEPISSIADLNLNNRDIIVLPDILTMSGGPISSYAEYCGESSDMAFSWIDSRVRETTKLVVERSMNMGIPIRRVAKELAKERILQKFEVAE